MDFDERSGIVKCQTKWGCWWQTIGEVYVEITCAEPVSSKNIKCDIKTQHLRCAVNANTVIEGKLYGVVRLDDCTWTLEDKKVIRILLAKAHPDAGNCWPSLLAPNSGDEIYTADQFVFDQMQRKLTLERFQNEQPGFDFSTAEISGNYQGGGPRLPV